MEGHARSRLLPEQLRPHCRAARDARKSACSSISFANSICERRRAISQAEQLKARRNAETAEIAKLRTRGRRHRRAPAADARVTPTQISALDEQVKALDEQFRELLAGIPNIPHESVPVGKSEADNVEVRRWGAAAGSSISSPRRTGTSGPELGILDLERAAKITGARFALYWDMGAKLERALINFMLDVHTREHGYTEVLPPFLVNSQQPVRHRPVAQVQGGPVQVRGPRLLADPHRRSAGHQHLSAMKRWRPTALPVQLCAYTPCFRSEAGSYGRDVRGIIRAAPVPEGGAGEVHARRTRATTSWRSSRPTPKTFCAAWGCRSARWCCRTGDMGFSSAKTYDIEVWLPGQNGYKEISSCSNFEAFQARRAGIRFRSGKKAEFAPHAQRQRAGRGPHLGRDRRELPAEGRQRGGSRGAAALPERGSDPPAEVKLP